MRHLHGKHQRAARLAASLVCKSHTMLSVQHRHNGTAGLYFPVVANLTRENVELVPHIALVFVFFGQRITTYMSG